MPTSIRKIKASSKEVSLKRILRDKRKRIRLYFLVSGILFIGLGLFLSKEKSVPVTTVQTNNTTTSEVFSFSQEPVKVDKAFYERKISKDKNPPIRIIIPDIDIDLLVKEAKVVKGYWEVFPDSAGFGLGSAYPDEEGNQVIFAHARDKLFLPLKKAKVGQSIIVLTKDKWYSYKIDSIKEVLPTQIEVIAPTTETVLTLYTCSGYADSKRLIVTARRV